MIRKIRKKPIVIETIQWTGDNWDELCKWGNEKRPEEGHAFLPGPGTNIRIVTLEGTMEAVLGSWVVCGVNNEFYAITAPIFEKTYDIVEE